MYDNLLIALVLLFPIYAAIVVRLGAAAYFSAKWQYYRNVIKSS